MSMTRGLEPMPSDAELLRRKAERERARSIATCSVCGDARGILHVCPRPPRLGPDSPLAATPLEAEIQAAFFDLVRANEHRHPALAATYAVGNESKGGARAGYKANRMGRRKGQPDVCVPHAGGNPAIPMVGYRALYVEFKRPREKPTKAQLERHAILRACGNRVAVAYSADEAWEIVCDHLGIAP